MIEGTVSKYGAADIPLEAIWLDIPYLDNYSDFSVDSVAFPTIGDYVNNVLHPNNQKIVVILDAGLSADDLDNKYYKMAQELGVTV
jgi:alpha-glucosidase (family GH31 glycosyl hydrolase)